MHIISPAPLQHMQVVTLESTVALLRSEHCSGDAGLKGRMQQLLQELHSTLKVGWPWRPACSPWRVDWSEARSNAPLVRWSSGVLPCGAGTPARLAIAACVGQRLVLIIRGVGQ